MFRAERQATKVAFGNVLTEQAKYIACFAFAQVPQASLTRDQRGSSTSVSGLMQGPLA